MANDLTRREPEAADDGFHGSLNSGRLLKGSYLKWTDAAHWVDRDGLTPPSPLLVIAINEVLQRWKNNKAEVIADKPLPDPEQLNSAIPQAEWERGTDGQLRKPWAHVVVVYLVNLATGEFYTYTSPTVGAHIAYDALKEAVITMRALRGAKCMPLVNLDERPMKTAFGVRRRPHYQIVGWNTPGDDARAIPVKPTPPQLSAPTVAAETPLAPAAAAAAAAPAPTTVAGQPRQATPKPPVKLTGETLATMGDVKPVTLSEVLDDEIPF
jgi:hypothetical protein